jgi:hypothetical protein
MTEYSAVLGTGPIYSCDPGTMSSYYLSVLSKVSPLDWAMKITVRLCNLLKISELYLIVGKFCGI